MNTLITTVARSALKLIDKAIVHDLDRHDLICALATLKPQLCTQTDAPLIAIIAALSEGEAATSHPHPALWVANEVAGCLHSHFVRASIPDHAAAEVKAGLEAAWEQVLELSSAGALEVADYDELQMLFTTPQFSGDAA